MSFCIKCGRELKEGEKCNCQEQTKTPTQPESSIGNFNGTVGEREQMNQTNRMNQNTSERENKTKLLIIIGAVAMFIGCFMPFCKVSMFGALASVPYTDGDGIIVIVLAIVAVILAVLNLQKYSLIPTIIALIVTLYDVSHVSENTEGLGSPAIGAYVVIIGAVLAVAGGILYMCGKQKDKNLT